MNRGGFYRRQYHIGRGLLDLHDPDQGPALHGLMSARRELARREFRILPSVAGCRTHAESDRMKSKVRDDHLIVAADFHWAAYWLAFRHPVETADERTPGNLVPRRCRANAA